MNKTSRLCLLHAANSVVGFDNMCLLIPVGLVIKSAKTLQIYMLPVFIFVWLGKLKLLTVTIVCVPIYGCYIGHFYT